MNARLSSRLNQVRSGCVVIIPPALTYWFVATHGWPDLISASLFWVMYLLTGFGITIGFHRYFTHRSFEITRVWFIYALGILGSMALEGRLSEWITGHRAHHQHVDRAGDLHSPHRFGTGFLNILKGFGYSHNGWFFLESIPQTPESVRSDKIVARIDHVMMPAVLAGLVLPACIGVLLRGSFDYMVFDVIWGGFARIVFVHHITWSVNSVCHLWGSRPFATRDRSTNNKIIALVGLGEGNHNGHHAFPHSARHGLLPGERDLSYWVIQKLKRVGLVTNVIVPSAADIARKRAN